jgi:hypothetical protein
MSWYLWLVFWISFSVLVGVGIGIVLRRLGRSYPVVKKSTHAWSGKGSIPRRFQRRSPIYEGAEFNDRSPSLLEARRMLSLAITDWYKLPDDAVPSIAGSGDERAEDDIAYLKQAQTEAADHMKAAARALEAATEYAASLRSRASSGPEHR